jgi:pimeloyl-ACP methyl ester carboxylesterase
MPTIHVNDIDMSYSRRGQGPTVIAAHAATSNSVEIGWLAQAISRQGFSVVTPDLRGHGATPNPAPDLHLPRLVDDMLEFITALGRSPQHGAGFSLGGAVLLYSAMRRPAAFRSLVLLGTTYRASPERVGRALGVGPWDAQSPMVQRVFDPQTGILGGWDAPLESFSAITCPTLIICADRDEFNGPQDGLDLYETLPNADLLVVPRADHIGLVRHPLVMEAVRAFYERLPDAL